MKTKNSKKSEESLQKATDILQKAWWFSFFIVIAPLATGFAGYWIYGWFGQGFYIELSFSVITYMFALLFFYKAFDKYRNKPFFLNKRNNLLARIHVVYLISTLSLIVTPIFIFISPADSFTLLPLISFTVLYNIVYYYYRFQPIGFFNKEEGEFKHAANFQIIVKQPYNLIIFINYIAHLIFLSLTFFTDLSWFFALITNVVFYLITFITTHKISREINKSIKENKPTLKDLTKFKQRFVITITSLIFILLIQIPFVNMSFLGILYPTLEFMIGSFLSIIFALIYFKTLFYINYHYNSLLGIYKGSTRSDDSEEETPSGIKYQKYNTLLSGVLIGSITFFCFLIRIHWIILVILPFFFIFAYYEQKAKMCPKEYNKYIYLLISTSILIAISFGLFSSILLNIQFIIFLISSYFSLQVLAKVKYFVKENIIIIQNFLAIASFTIIIYSLFGYTSFDNLIIFDIAGKISSNPLIIFISNIILHGILISVISLVSFYILYARLFSIKRSKLFRISIFAQVFLIELFIFILVNLWIFSVFSGITALRLLILSSLLFPSIFILFIFANYLLGVLSNKNFLIFTYIFLWVLIADIFLVIFFVFLNTAVMLVMLTVDFLFLSIFSQFNLKLGLHLGKVKDSSFERYLKINPYILTLELFFLFFFTFYSIISIIFIDLIWYNNIIFSSHFSLLVMTFLINILSRSNRVFSTSLTFNMNLIFLTFSAGLAFYYSFYYTFGTFYVFLIPFLSLFSILFFPIYYLYRKKIHLPLEKKYQEEEQGEEEKEKNIMRKFLIADSIILTFFITLIPSIISLEIYVYILSTISYTILILPSILIFFVCVNHLLGVFTRKQFLLINHYVLWLLITDIFVAIFLTFPSNFVILALDFLFFSVFSQFNLKFGLYLGKVKDSSFERYIKINPYILTLEFFALFFFTFYSIISIIFIDLIWYNNIIFSSYFSLLVMTFLINILSRSNRVFSAPLAFNINLTFLISSAGIAFYYSFLYTLGTYYVFLIPFLSLFSILFLPIYYLFRRVQLEPTQIKEHKQEEGEYPVGVDGEPKKRIYENFLRKFLIANSIILAIFITLIPGIISLESYRLVSDVNILPVISSTILIFPSFLIFFGFVNHLLGVLSRKQLLLITHYLLWLLITDIFVAIFLTFPSNFVILALDFLFFSVFSQLNLKLGSKLERVKKATLKRYINVNSYIIAVELFTLLFFFFYSIILTTFALFDNIVFSIYFSLLIMVPLGYLFSSKEFIFSISMSIKINMTALIFSAGLAFYYSFLYTFNTFYVFLIPFLCLFSTLFFPIYYLLRMKRYENLTRKILVIDCILIAIFLTLIPSIISLDSFFRFGVALVDVISVLNFTFYIAFTLLIFIHYLVKHYGMKEMYKLGILKSQVLIAICLTGTTVFYYIFILLSGMMYMFLIPFIAASCFFYLPILFSYKKRLFNVNLVKNSIFVNSLLLSGLIVVIPTIVGVGLGIDFFMITVLTLILLFVILKFLDFICMKFKIFEKIIKHLKLLETITWFSFSLFTALWIFPYLLTDLSLSLSIFIYFMLNIYTLRLISNYSKELKISKHLRESILYGIVFSSSYLLITLLQITGILNFLPSGLTSLNIVWYLGLFFLFSLLLIKSKLIELEFVSLRNWLEFISWFLFKIFICLFISRIFPFSILTQIIIFILCFSILTPISLTYFKNLKIVSDETQYFTKKVFLATFIISSLSLFLDIFNTLTRNIPSFNIFNLLPLTVITASSFLFLYFCFLRYNSVIANYSTTRLIRFYLSSFLLLTSLFFMLTVIPGFSFITLILILSRRTIINIFRFLVYLLLGYVLLIAITASPFGPFIYMNTLDVNLLGYYSQIYLVILSIVLLFSIWLNYKKNNIFEKFTLYTTFSLLSFVLLYTITPLIYNITISLFIFLFFTGIYLYRLKNVLYKWFIKPCVMLAVFDIVSFISYFLLFNQQRYVGLNPILTFTLTMGVTGFCFVFLFNKAPANFRKKSFYFVLLAIILCIPTFLYFLIVSSFSIPFEDPIPIIFSINIGVVLFYLCVGIYQWRISWAIWKSGWYAWNLLPFANFIIIYKSLSGVDVIANSSSLFGTITGSSIISIIICSLFFLPVIYTKIKNHFSKLIFIVWGESLFLLYWISQNLFSRAILSDIWLKNIVFVLFAVLLLMPILIALKYWKIVSVFWVTLIAINASFLLFYLVSIGISLEVTISIDILVIGLLMIIYSFFPNVRSIGIILIISYFIVLTGIFMTVYFIILSIIQNYLFAVNVSLMVVGFSLFSSKSVKLSHRIIDLCLSWILIFNFAWLTFNTFSLIPQLELFAFFLALTVLGCSFFIFNKYKLKFHINRAIPLFVVAIGATSSITSLFSIFLNISPYMLISIFSGIFLIFLYFIIIEYRHFLWSLIPIPLALPVLELLLSIEIIRSMWILAFLTFSITYITFFQVIFNIFKNYKREDTIEMKYEGDDTIEMKNSMKKIFQDKDQIKLVNFTSFILNSLFISLFISILVPIIENRFLFNQIIFVYQIIDFLIIWPIFILFSLKYIEKFEIKIKLKAPLLFINNICFAIYFLIPTAMGINLLLLMIYANVNIIIIFYSITLMISGVIFFESFVIDRRFFCYLFNSARDKFTFWSFSVFINTLSLFFFIFHSNFFLLLSMISLLNQLSLSFLSKLDISKTKISIGRLILYYSLFVTGSFFIGSLISNGIIILFEELSGVPYYLLLFQNSLLILFMLSYFLLKFDVKLKSSIEVILLTVFQSLFAINMIIIFSLFNILNIFLIILIIIIETCISFQTIKYVNSLFYEEKKPEFLKRAFSLLIILLYLETSLLFYGLMNIFVGIIESILVSQLVFLVLTLLDIYLIKKIKRGYAQLIHTLSFFVISLMTFLILNTATAQYQLYQIMLSLGVLLFIFMQFYTKYSFFASLYLLYPNKKELIDKRKTLLTRVIGISFYANLFFILLQTLLIFSADLQLTFLILSLLVHILMIIDTHVMKFIGKVSNYFLVFSWVSIMSVTTTYLIWIYILYFPSFLATSIPLIIFILIIEAAYFFKLLDFSKYVISNKEKIKNILIFILYLDFITWPVYSATLNPFYLLNLLIGSVGILFILTYVDEYIGVFNEKHLLNLRKISFLTIGILLSSDIYILLGFIPSLNLFFKLSVALLSFVIFLGIIVKPFKGHSLIAFAFWGAIFSLLSSIIFFSSNSLEISVTILGITLLIYPFVFLLEELRELFNKFVDVLIKTFKKIKVLLINSLKAIFNFVKTNFKVIWTIISAFLGIFFGILLSDLFLHILNPIHASLLALAIFGLLYQIIPYAETKDPDIIFKRRILRLSLGWGSVIGLLLIVITPEWYLFTGFISTAVVGTIILVFLGRKEEREKISVKWRFYTLLSLFVLLILFGILFFIQLSTIAI